MTNSEFRAAQAEARDHGLRARQEARLENATYTAAEVKVLTEAALRLGRKEQLEEVQRQFERITYASDDGTEFEHTHPAYEGEPECPACWVQHIRDILGIKLPPKAERPLHVMSCDDCRADLDTRDHYPDCGQMYPQQGPQDASEPRTEAPAPTDLPPEPQAGSKRIPDVHKPFPDDGVTYCGWHSGNGVVHEGCGEVWPCSAVRNLEAP